VALSQAGSVADRRLLLIDSNRDLYLVHVLQRATAKLGAMVDSARWHDSTQMVAAMVDGNLTVW